MKFFFILSLIAVAACDEPQHQCWERACKPDWSGDCSCSPDQTMERQPDGIIICRCKTDAGH